MSGIDVFVLIIQSMQLPLVALIIIFILGSIFSNTIKAEVWNSANSYDIESFKSSFRFIAFGLILNILYLIINILGKEFINFFSRNSTSYYILVSALDILTSLFFIAGTIAFIRNKITLSLKVSPKWDFLLKTRNVLFLLILIAGLIYSHNWTIINAKQSDYHLDFHLYNFISYFFVGYYLFKRFSVHFADNTRIYSNYYIGIGFLIWASLQLLQPLVGLFDAEITAINTDSNSNIEIIGFSLSTLSKFLILSGLYGFSTKLAAYTHCLTVKKNYILKE